jgi:hypothetical protein
MKRALLCAFASSLVILSAAAGCRSGFQVQSLNPASVKTQCLSCSYYNDFYTDLLPPAVKDDAPEEWVIRDVEGWNAFFNQVNDAAYLTEVPAPPLDFSRKMLVVKIVHCAANQEVIGRDVCIGEGGVKVKYEINENCMTYDNAVTRLLAYAVDPADGPVLWEGTFIPYTGVPCTEPTPIFVRTPIIWFTPY